MRVPGDGKAVLRRKIQPLPVHAALADQAVGRNGVEFVLPRQGQAHPLAAEQPLAIVHTVLQVQRAQLHHILRADVQARRADGVLLRITAPGCLAEAHGLQDAPRQQLVHFFARNKADRPRQQIKRAVGIHARFARTVLQGR